MSRDSLRDQENLVFSDSGLVRNQIYVNKKQSNYINDFRGSKQISNINSENSERQNKHKMNNFDINPTLKYQQKTQDQAQTTQNEKYNQDESNEQFQNGYNQMSNFYQSNDLQNGINLENETNSEPKNNSNKNKNNLDILNDLFPMKNGDQNNDKENNNNAFKNTFIEDQNQAKQLEFFLQNSQELNKERKLNYLTSNVYQSSGIQLESQSLLSKSKYQNQLIFKKKDKIQPANIAILDQLKQQIAVRVAKGLSGIKDSQQRSLNQNQNINSLLQNRNQQEQQIKHQTISKLIIKQYKKVSIKQTILDENEIIQENYLLSYDFEQIPSRFIAQEKSTGRYFIYDNNNKILCFSGKPFKHSDRDDRSRPLVEMFLEDENPRIDPTLYVHEFKDFSCLLVIGGYKRSKFKNSIIINQSIKVFKLEKRNISSSYVSQIQLQNKRQNPIVMCTNNYEKDNLNENQNQLNSDLLLFIGGNHIYDHRDIESNRRTNETCEALSCEKLYEMVNSKRIDRKNPYQIQISLNLTQNNVLIRQEHIRREYFTKGISLNQENPLQNSEYHQLIFGQNSRKVYLVSSIDLNQKKLDLQHKYDLKNNCTIEPQMGCILNNCLYYYSDNNNDMQVVEFKNQKSGFRVQITQTLNPISNINNINYTSSEHQLETIKKFNTVQGKSFKQGTLQSNTLRQRQDNIINSHKQGHSYCQIF